MRLPQRSKSKAERGKVSRSVTLPAPMLGWYVGTNITDAPRGSAFIADNVFPREDYYRVRRGAQSYATGIPSAVKTLMPYVSGTTTRFFAACSTGVYDVTVAGAVGAAATTCSFSDFAYTQFTTSGATYLVAANGVNNVKTYDGSTWADASITGVGFTSSNMNNVWQYKSRLYFLEKQSMKAWYLPVDSVGGTATSLNLGGIFSLGGYLIAGCSWAISSNSGLYETCVFITSEGQVAFYDGDYPGATNWTLKGVYKIARPLGTHCVFKAGGDIGVMTEDGIIPLSTAMELDEIAIRDKAVTKPVAPYWRQLTADRRGMTGWSFTEWPIEGMIIINVPQLTTNDKQQLISNGQVWCRYTGWDAKCFAVYNGYLYYGTSDGRVMQAEVGGKDDGSPYTAVLAWSFTDFNVSAVFKQIKMMRAIMQTNLATAPQFDVLADYNTVIPIAPSVAASTTSTFIWDVSKWDVDAVWPGATTRQADWKALAGFGTAVAPIMQITISNTDQPDVRITQLDLVLETGEAIG